MRLPSAEGIVEYIFLHDVVALSPAASTTDTKFFRRRPFASRATAISICEEEESRSILESVDTQLHRRRKGAAVRLEIEAEREPGNYRAARGKFPAGALAGVSREWADQSCRGFSIFTIKRRGRT